MTRDRPRRHRVLVGLLAVLALAGFASGASAASDRTRLTFLTSTVSPGGTLTLKASAPSGARCSAILAPSQLGSQIKLGTRRVAHGRVVWSHRLPVKEADLGRWKATVACSVGGSASRQFRLAVPVVAPAQIDVVNSGFFDQTYSFSSSAFLDCGVELKNVSRTDARNVTAIVTFTDTQGTSVAASATSLSLIPAGQVFYMSCLQETSVSITVAAVQVSVKVGASALATGTLPAVADLTLTPDPDDGFQTLTGSLTDPYKTPLSQNATIYALYYDAGGNFVGGDSENTGAAVQPGASDSFSFSNVPVSAASAQVSVDPCGSIDASLGLCKLT